MYQDNHIPPLLSFYFGSSDLTARRGASRRLKHWSCAFDRWIDERRLVYPTERLRRDILSFRRLLLPGGKMPWQLTTRDIEQHTAWMAHQGFAARTINYTLGVVTAFYLWCDEHNVDSACSPGFNPASGVTRLKINLYAGASLWSREEISAFLGLLERDCSVLGRRDYAFFLARLSLGVNLICLRKLSWQQLELNELGAWVRWTQAAERVPLPGPLWPAIEAYLRASGRLSGMLAGKYIFTPLATTGSQVTGTQAEDWREHQPLIPKSILTSLKLYGRRVGIPEPKLNVVALRLTALRLKMDAGESPQGMKIFMQARDSVANLKYKLGKLPGLPAGSVLDGKRQVDLPVRTNKLFKVGEHTTHGLYSRHKDRKAVQAILEKDIHGMEDEIACLRKLMRGLLACQGEDAHLVDVYSQAAHRLGQLVSSPDSLPPDKEDTWAEGLLSKLDEIEQNAGRPPVSQQMRQNALGMTSDQPEAAGIMLEEIATLRLLLGNVYQRAQQGVEMGEYLHLADLYGRGCMRLARLLKMTDGEENGRLARYLNAGIDQAIQYLTREWGLDENES